METYVVHVTKECNADCLYCYEKDKDSVYEWAEVKQFLDRILKNRTSDQFAIEFLGGEPLMAWDNIKRTYEYLESVESIDVFSYIITTNGTILTDEILDYLIKNSKLRFVASLDGHKWSNQLRVFKESRKNTYDKVMHNLKKLQENGVENAVHMVTHPYNVAFLSESIIHLYNKGVKAIDPGIVESTITIDEDFAARYIHEMNIISEMIANGELKGLHVGVLEWLKPYEDERSYMIDRETGKTIGESYGRSGSDITHTEDYKVNRFAEKDTISELIYKIRETVYSNHRKRLSK